MVAVIDSGCTISITAPHVFSDSSYKTLKTPRTCEVANGETFTIRQKTMPIEVKVSDKILMVEFFVQEEKPADEEDLIIGNDILMAYQPYQCDSQELRLSVYAHFDAALPVYTQKQATDIKKSYRPKSSSSNRPQSPAQQKSGEDTIKSNCKPKTCNCPDKKCYPKMAEIIDKIDRRI